jgi:hypothetical protein
MKEVFKKRARGEKYFYDREMTGKKLPASVAKVPFTYMEPST